MKCQNHRAGLSGCEWVGELGNLEAHLRLCPCVYIECSVGCGDVLMRRDLARHVEHLCYRRTVRCEYCGLEGTYELIADEHYDACPQVPFACPHGCSTDVLPRAELPAHLAACPLQPVACEFSEFGCEPLVPRKDLSFHLSSEQSRHLSLVLAAVRDLRQAQHSSSADADVLREEVQACKKSQTNLVAVVGTVGQISERLSSATDPSSSCLNLSLGEIPVRLTEMEQHLKAHARRSATDPFLPVVIEMRGFSRLKRNNEPWYSEPFYFEPLGYRLCLCVYARGCCNGAGTHLSVFVHVMRGAFDGRLEWPIEEEITVSLQNQLSDAHHWSNDCSFFEELPPHVCARVRGAGASRARRGSGTPTFIPLGKLYSSTAHRNYLKNNCLFFEVC